MSEYAEIAERFAKETAEHEMTIRHDDGLWRHLRFRHPDHGFYWFDLITVPHALIFRGDGESFVFDRIDDMFAFFRSGIRPDGSIRINPTYWAEKLTSNRDCVKAYDEDLFKRQVKEHVADAIRDGSAPRGISKAVREEIFEAEEIGWEDGARQLLRDFGFGEAFRVSCLACKERGRFDRKAEASEWQARHAKTNSSAHVTFVNSEPAFQFYDVWEWDLRDYTWWFLWALHAIVWGIAQYDAAKAAEKQPVAVSA